MSTIISPLDILNDMILDGIMSNCLIYSTSSMRVELVFNLLVTWVTWFVASWLSSSPSLGWLACLASSSTAVSSHLSCSWYTCQLFSSIVAVVTQCSHYMLLVANVEGISLSHPDSLKSTMTIISLILWVLFADYGLSRTCRSSLYHNMQIMLLVSLINY